MKRYNGKEAVILLDQLREREESEPASIPCGYQELISEGKTLTCGMTYRGHIFYCRDCMTQMLKNAHEWANGLAELTLLAVNDHYSYGKISDNTLDTMRTFLINMGCISVRKDS